eukprot:3446182-Prymnesium_polylepis.5
MLRLTRSGVGGQGSEQASGPGLEGGRDGWAARVEPLTAPTTRPPAARCPSTRARAPAKAAAAATAWACGSMKGHLLGSGGAKRAERRCAGVGATPDMCRGARGVDAGWSRRGGGGAPRRCSPPLASRVPAGRAASSAREASFAPRNPQPRGGRHLLLDPLSRPPSRLASLVVVALLERAEELDDVLAHERRPPRAVALVLHRLDAHLDAERREGTLLGQDHDRERASGGLQLEQQLRERLARDLELHLLSGQQRVVAHDDGRDAYAALEPLDALGERRHVELRGHGWRRKVPRRADDARVKPRHAHGGRCRRQREQAQDAAHEREPLDGRGRQPRPARRSPVRSRCRAHRHQAAMGTGKSS